MKFLFVQGMQYFSLLLVIYHKNFSVSTSKIHGAVPSLSNATWRFARNNRPYIPLNSLTFQAVHNDGSHSWMNQGPTLLKQMLKKSKLGGSFKDGGDSVQGLIQERKKTEMQSSNEEFYITKENGVVSVLIGHNKSIINVPDSYLKMRQKLETRKIDGNKLKISSEGDERVIESTTTSESHEDYPLKKSIIQSGAEKNADGNLLKNNNNRTELSKVSHHKQSITNESNYETSGLSSKTIFNRRFIPSASKVKLAELEKTIPSKTHPESNIIWIFTTPEHTYTLSATTESTYIDNDTTVLTTEQPTTEGGAEINNSLFSTFEENITNETESYFSTVTPDNEDTQEELNEEETASTPQTITSDYSIKQHPLTTNSVKTTTASIDTTSPQTKELSTPRDSIGRPTTRKSNNEFFTPTSVYQFTRTYPVSTNQGIEKLSTLGNKKIDSSSSSPFFEGSKHSNINKLPQFKNDTNNQQTSSLGSNNYDYVTTTPEKMVTSYLATTKLTSQVPSAAAEADYTSSYPTELDILKEIKKVFQSLSNDINLQTGAAINKDLYKKPQNQTSYFDNFDSESSTKSSDKNSYSVTESYAFFSNSTTDNDFQTPTEGNLVSVLDSLLGNLKTDNRTVTNSEDPPDNFINDSKPYPVIGLSYVNNTTPNTYLTKYDNPYSQYTPLVQLNVWNYLNGHLQLTETQAVPSPTIDIINSPEVSVNNEQKQSFFLLPQGASSSGSIDDKVLEKEEWLSNHKITVTTESNKLMTPSVTHLEEVKSSPDPFEYINILNYLEEQISSPSTTTETSNVIPENLYEFVMNHENKNVSKTTKYYVRDKIETPEVTPIKGDLKSSNYKLPIKASSFVLHSPPRKVFTTATVKYTTAATSSTHEISDKRDETNYSLFTTPSYVLQSNKKNSYFTNLPVFNDSERPSLPQRNETTLPAKKVIESSGGIFNNTYLPSFLQIYQQQNNQNSQLITNHLNTQQFITINNHPSDQNNNNSSNAVTSPAPQKKISDNVQNDKIKLPLSPLNTQKISSPESVSLEESIHVLNDSNHEPSLLEGYPKPNTFNQKNSSASSINDPLLNIDSATLVKEYIKRISVISQFFKQYDVTKPETASIIENLALKSLLSYILGEEDILAHELNKKVVMNEPSTQPMTNSNKNEISTSQSTLTEADYEISIISKLVFDAVLQDGDGQNSVSRLPLLQNSNSNDDVNKKPVTETEEPLVVHNQEDNRPLLLEIKDLNSTKQEESYFDSLTFNWLLTTIEPEIEEPLLEEELDEEPTLVDNIKNSVTGITGMISNLVPSGSTFQDCLNRLSCSFALASSLAIGATGVMAIPLLLPFGRKKKQILFEESRIFGQPIQEQDGSLITDQKLKIEFKRVLSYLAHPDEHKTDRRINEMKGNLIKYLKEEYDKIQKERRSVELQRQEQTENNKEPNEYKTPKAKYRNHTTNYFKNYKWNI